MSYVFIITIIYVGVVCIIAVAGETEEATQKRVQAILSERGGTSVPPEEGLFARICLAMGAKRSASTCFLGPV